MKVTGLPRQKGFVDAAITRLTGKLLLVVIDSVLLVIGFANGQSILEVNTQETKSPFNGMYEYVDRFDPTAIPLTFH